MERRDRQTYRPELASSNIAFDRTGTSTPYCTPYPDHEGRMRTPMERHLIVTAALTALLAACSEHTAPSALNGPRAGVVETRLGQNGDPNRPRPTAISHHHFHNPTAYTAPAPTQLPPHSDRPWIPTDPVRPASSMTTPTSPAATRAPTTTPNGSRHRRWRSYRVGWDPRSVRGGSQRRRRGGR